MQPWWAYGTYFKNHYKSDPQTLERHSTSKWKTYKWFLQVAALERCCIQVIFQLCYLFIRCILLSSLCFEGTGEVSFVFSEFGVVWGELVEGQLQLFHSLLLGCLLRLAIHEEEHQTGDDEGLDQRREEEDDPHIVAAAFPLLCLADLFRFQSERGPGVAAVVHFWGPVVG